MFYSFDSLELKKRYFFSSSFFSEQKSVDPDKPLEPVQRLGPLREPPHEEDGVRGRVLDHEDERSRDRRLRGEDEPRTLRDVSEDVVRDGGDSLKDKVSI